MRETHVRRWFAAGITGTLFAILMLALAAPVAADSSTLVTPLPGQNPNSNIIVVASPGFINNGTATNPLVNGGLSCNVNACYPPGTVCTIYGCGIPATGVGPTCTVYSCGTLGYTAAGPIVGQLPNGVLIVAGYDGNTYMYTFNPTTGKYVETDASGIPINDVTPNT